MTKRQFAEEPRAFRPMARPARKRAVNVTVDESVLAEARALKINLSMALEIQLKSRIRERKLEEFRKRHARAVENHNRFIEENGIWSERYRSW